MPQEKPVKLPPLALPNESYEEALEAETIIGEGNGYSCHTWRPGMFRVIIDVCGDEAACREFSEMCEAWIQNHQLLHGCTPTKGNMVKRGDMVQ